MRADVLQTRQAYSGLGKHSGRSRVFTSDAIWAPGPPSVPFIYILHHSWWPPHWSTLLLTPIPKPNKPTDTPDSYIQTHTPLSITLAKLFSVIVDTAIRETPLLDNLTPQFGFRTHRGTRDGTFLTHSALHFAKLHNKPLYMCFVDF